MAYKSRFINSIPKSMKLKRFYLASVFGELAEIAIKLNDLNFEELDHAVNEYQHLDQRIIIDTEKKHWWFTDESFEHQCREIISTFYGERIYVTNLKNVSKWQARL